MKKKKMKNSQLANLMKKNYSVWKKTSLNDKGFFVLFNDFKTSGKLKNVGGNALKLYVYLGIYSDNNTGEVWHGNKTIAEYFDKSERTIRLWMQELEDLNLIKRMQLKFNGESHTFLQPYTVQTLTEQSEKYTYTYRLKSKFWRELVNLMDYDSEIKEAVLNTITSKCYVKVSQKEFNINSFKPLETKLLKSLGKNIRGLNDDFNNFAAVYNYTKKDGTEGVKQILFEKIHSKKTKSEADDGMEE